MRNERSVNIAILTVSDRCSRGEAEDKSGPRLCEMASRLKWNVAEVEMVPDEKDQIQDTLLGWCDKGTISLILTTGGTGLSPRDVTPEATREILDKEIPGLAELMRSAGRKHNPFSPLSRTAVGVRKNTLIVNLPGSPKGAEQSLRIILKMVPHALDMMAGHGHPKEEVHHAHAT